MRVNLKKVLLTGTAVVAVSFVAQAQAATITPVADTTLVTNTGAAGPTQAGDAAGNPGTDSYDFGAPTITLTNPSGVTQTGGAGSTGGADANSSGGNAGGAGGNGISFNNQDGTSTSSHPSLVNNGTILGGRGGDGGVGNASVGGNGAVGGAGVNDDADFSHITGSGTSTGGAGGNGGAANAGNRAGGTGGVGGNGDTLSGSNIVFNVSGNQLGGAGGAGGTSTGTANNTNGATGGAGIVSSGTGEAITIGSGASIVGGAGGAAGTGGSGTAAVAGTGGIGLAFTAGTGTLSNAGIIRGGGGTGNALDLSGGANLSTVTNSGRIGSASTGTGNGVNVAAGTTIGTLTNTGTLSSVSGIAVNNAGTLTTLTNTGGTITTTTGTAYSDTTANAAALNNSNGTVSATAAAGKAIVVNAAGAVLTLNNAGGTISATTGSAITVGATGATGRITGSTASGLTGTITNAGLTDANATLALNSTAQGALTNSGTISNTNAGNTAVAVALDVATGGTFTNAGTITANGAGNHGGVAIDYVATNTVVNSGTINGQITDTGAPNATLTNTGAINGAITFDGGGANTITNNGGTITGAITGGAGVDALVLGGGTLTGAINLAAGANTLATTAATGTSTINGAITTSSAITTTVAAGTTLALEGATNALGTGTITTAAANGGNAAASLLVGGNVTTTGAFTNNGSTTLGVGHTLTVGSQAGAGNYTFDIANSSNTGFGKLAVTAGGVTLSNLRTTADLTNGGFVANGAKLQIATGSAAATITPGAVADNSATVSFNLVRGDAAGVGGTANQAYLIATRTTAAQLGSNGNESNVQNALNAIGSSSSDASFNAVQNNVSNASSAGQANRTFDSLEPTVDGGNMIAAIGVTDQSFDITDERMADARTGDQTGMAAGNWTNGAKVWVQGFGQHAKQYGRDDTDGYRANTFGGALGVDSANLLDNALVGMDFSYGRSTVDSANVNSTTDDIDSYQVTLYGATKFNTGYKYLNKLFVDGMVAYAYDHNDQTRHDVGGTGLDADSDYGANQVAARLSAGEDFRSYWGATLTPSLVGDYIYYNANSYTESGAGGAGLRVDQDDYNQLDLGVALKAGWAFKLADGSALKPDAHVGYRYDVLDNDVDATSNFEAGGPSFKTDGLRPGRNIFNAGLDLKFYAVNNWEFSGSYDFEAKDKFTANAGLLRAAYKF